MTCTDPIADMLTAIRNALCVKFASVEVKHSRLKEEILKILKTEGYIKKYDVTKKDSYAVARIELKYGKNGEQVIHEIKRVSTPGCRVYLKKADIPNVKNRLGITILTTPNGVKTGATARREGVGGELLCEVW
jgi:small subunit ribosomal protein S8